MNADRECWRPCKACVVITRVPDYDRCGKLQPPVISFVDVAFSYSGKREDFLFSKLHFGIDSDSRIALVGPNGAGKSTLLKVHI